MIYTINIKTKPVGKQRPRITKFRGSTRVYTPEATKNFETKIKLQFKKDYPRVKPIEGYVKVYIEAGLQIPKSISKIKRQEMIDNLILPSKTPDIDNIIKSALDGLNGVAWLDDKQVIFVSGLKIYSEHNYIKIKVEQINDISGIQD